MEADVPEFEYLVEPLPPSRVGRRWRWQLWRGDRLLAAGWTLGERRARRSLHTAASRAAHELAGVVPLRPERTTADPPLVLAGAGRVRLAGEAAVCLLVPRAPAGARAEAA
jgi:hypothetical protein